MEEVDEELSLLCNLAEIEIGRREKRPICDNCSRPAGVCWCRGLRGRRVTVQSKIIVLQHPHEEKRCLRTAPILKAGLPPDGYLELRGKRFTPARHPELAPILASPNTILMYPGEGARSLEDLPRVGELREEAGRGVEKSRNVSDCQEVDEEELSLELIQACTGSEAGQQEGQQGGQQGQRSAYGGQEDHREVVQAVETSRKVCERQELSADSTLAQQEAQQGHGSACGGQEGHERGQIQPPYNIVILDGTWQQAKSIYHNCSCLHPLPQVCLSGRYTSEYIIRTQPTDDALSTVETAALGLAILEGDWSIYDTLVEPLRVLCGHQLSHGAIPHQSKEFLLVSGRCRRALGKRTYKKLKKCGARYPQALAALVVAGTGAGTDGKADAKEGKEKMKEKDMKTKNRVCEIGGRGEIGTDDDDGIGEKEMEIVGGTEEKKTVDCVGKAKRNISSHVSWEVR